MRITRFGDNLYQIR